MWAFVRVKDPGSGLPKFVLINWVRRVASLLHRSETALTSSPQLGEGVPESKKGTFPGQSVAVAKFLKGYHVSLQARSEADVEPAHILKRVADSSGAKYSVHNEPAQKYQAPAPVSSSYVPVGRPTITQSKPVAPPTPVGTSYASKQNELQEIRARQAAEASRTPASPSVAAPKVATPPAGFTAPPVSPHARSSGHRPPRADLVSSCSLSASRGCSPASCASVACARSGQHSGAVRARVVLRAPSSSRESPVFIRPYATRAMLTEILLDTAGHSLHARLAAQAGQARQPVGPAPADGRRTFGPERRRRRLGQATDVVRAPGARQETARGGGGCQCRRWCQAARGARSDEVDPGPASRSARARACARRGRQRR